MVEARREKLAALLAQTGYLPVAELCRRLEISEATARRDLAALEEQSKITRTYGGALVEYSRRFPTFQQRQLESADTKRTLAARARLLIEPGMTCYFDLGTTVYAIAETLRRQPIVPLKAVTSSLPVAELLSQSDGVRVFLLGGELLPRQSALLGEMPRRELPMWNFNLAFLGAEAISGRGIWNSEKSIVQHQRAVMRQAEKSVFCIDRTKLGGEAPEFLMRWSRSIYLLTNATRQELEKHGIRLRPEQLLLN